MQRSRFMVSLAELSLRSVRIVIHCGYSYEPSSCIAKGHWKLFSCDHVIYARYIIDLTSYPLIVGQGEA